MRAGNSDSKDTFFRKLNTFNSVVRELQTGYVDTIDAEELMDNAIGMMLYQLDPTPSTILRETRTRFWHSRQAPMPASAR